MLTKEGTDPSLRSKRQALSVGGVASSLLSHPSAPYLRIVFLPISLSFPSPSLPCLGFLRSI